MTPPAQHDDDPAFDPVFAGQLVGKYVLVGLTYYRRDDSKVLRREQFHGRVMIADATDGIKIELGGKNTGTVKWLPPQTDVFQIASPGRYDLHDLQESVHDPDFLAMWDIHVPDA